MTIQSKRYIQILDNIPTSIKSPNFHFTFKKPMLKIKRMRAWKTHIHISGTVNASPIAILVYVQRRSKEGKGARGARKRRARRIRGDHDPTTRRGIMDTIIRRKIRGPRNIFITSFHTYTVMQEAQEGTNRVVLGGDRIRDVIPSSL